LRIRTGIALHQRGNSQVNAGKVWIGAEMIADHDAAFGCKLRENALQSFRTERRTRERGG